MSTSLIIIAVPSHIATEGRIESIEKDEDIVGYKYKDIGNAWYLAASEIVGNTVPDIDLKANYFEGLLGYVLGTHFLGHFSGLGYVRLNYPRDIIKYKYINIKPKYTNTKRVSRIINNIHDLHSEFCIIYSYL